MLSPRELDILNILYASGEPMTSTQIINAGTSRHLSQSTVIITLKKLTDKQLVDVVGFYKEKCSLAQLYQANEKAKKKILDDFLNAYKPFMHVIPVDELLERIEKLREVSS